MSTKEKRPEVVVSGLQRAIAVMGMSELSRRLGASPEEIREWINKYAAMPERKVHILQELEAISQPK